MNAPRGVYVPSCPTCAHEWHGGEGCSRSYCWCLSKYDHTTLTYRSKMIEGDR